MNQIQQSNQIDTNNTLSDSENNAKTINEIRIAKSTEEREIPEIDEQTTAPNNRLQPDQQNITVKFHQESK